MDLNKIPYARWLEDGLRMIAESGADKLCLVAMDKDGTTYTGYWNLCAADKAVVAYHIQTDAMWDTLEANRDRLQAIMDAESDDQWEELCDGECV